MDGLNINKEMEWKKAIVEEMRKRVYPGDSDEMILNETQHWIDRCDLSDTPREVVTEFIEKYDLMDLEDPWMG
jgi:hypothetical protein